MTGFYGQNSKIGILPVTAAAFYGQNSKIGVLPVTSDWILRADLKNQCFARNLGLHFTGRIQKSAFCP
ncbi:vitamin B12-binding protein [Ligilactobacillus ruminis]|uniref:vitamin B12-binding protein n=1 Tax=Ligilactobacillus ruminis TaxID=1623 RepID=UPI003F9A7C94